MSATPHILYVKREDEIISLLDSIDAVAGTDVLLAVPRQAVLFRDLLNVKLLKRECEKLGKNIAISTQDLSGISLAKKAGIPVEMPSEGEKFFEEWSDRDPKAKRASADTSGSPFTRQAATALPDNPFSKQTAAGAESRYATSTPAPAERTVVGKVATGTRLAARTRPVRGMDIAVRRPAVAAGAKMRTLKKAAPAAQIAAEKPKATATPEATQPVIEPVMPEPAAFAPRVRRQQPVMTADRPSQEADRPGSEELVPMDRAQSASDGDVETLANIESLGSGETAQGSRRGKKVWIFAFLAVIAAFGAAAAFLVKPSATVRVYPKSESVEFEMDISGRADISSLQVEKAIVPLERVRVSEVATKEFPTTGDRDVTTKAHGMLSLYNAFSSAPQALVATTRFMSESGKVFRTPKAVTIPGARVDGGTMTPGVIDIEVVADEAGDAFNIPAGRFTIPGFAGTPKEKAFYGVSQEPMIGGFKGKTRVVEKKDIEEARMGLIASEKQRLEAALREKFPPNLYFIDGSLAISSSETGVSPREGEPGDMVKISVETSAEALLFREEDVQKIIDPNIASHLAEEFTISPEGRKMTYTMRQFDTSLGRLAFTVLVAVRTEAVLKPAELSAKLAGMHVQDTKEFFSSRNNIERADLSLWPFWSRRLPADATRIKVEMGKK